MKRTYSREFKVKACELVTKEGIKHAVVAEKLGINKIMLYQWIDQYETYGEAAFVGKGHLRPEDAELRKLRKENERLKTENEILKKSSGILCEKPGRRIRFAKTELKEYDTSTVCRMIEVSRSEYYRRLKAPDREEIELEKAVIHCFEENKGRYGRIRIRKELLKKGIQVSENKISRLLKKNGLLAKSGRSGRRKPPKPTEEPYIEENLIKDKFSVGVPNMLWCSDITELKCKGARLYLCGIIDVATRRLVGWAIDKTQTQRLVQNAFFMAVGRNPERPAGAIYHSDRGTQYTAKKTKKLIEENGFQKSMSRPGTPSDNADRELLAHAGS